MEDESNLLYVAITRARKRLQMSRQLHKLLGQYGEKFYRLVPASCLRKDGTSLTCCVLCTTFEPQSTVVLCRRKLTLVCPIHILALSSSSVIFLGCNYLLIFLFYRAENFDSSLNFVKLEVLIN